MDEADRADEQIAIDLAESLRRAALPSGPPRTPGVCSNCDEVLPSGQAYCDADCRSDHERRYSSDVRSGRHLPPTVEEPAENTTHASPEAGA